MYGQPDATLMALSAEPLDQRAINALQSAAKALGHESGFSVSAPGETSELVTRVFAADPWAVVALDDASIKAVEEAFGLAAGTLERQTSVQCPEGYTLVGVPGFAASLDDDNAKRVSWIRLKEARHPGNPLG